MQIDELVEEFDKIVTGGAQWTPLELENEVVVDNSNEDD